MGSTAPLHCEVHVRELDKQSFDASMTIYICILPESSRQDSECLCGQCNYQSVVSGCGLYSKWSVSLCVARVITVLWSVVAGCILSGLWFPVSGQWLQNL